MTSDNQRSLFNVQTFQGSISPPVQVIEARLGKAVLTLVDMKSTSPN